MITKHYITRSINSRDEILSISQKTWALITQDIFILFDMLPDGIKLGLKDGLGSPLIDSNVIQFSPGKEVGSDFTFKRVDSKSVVTIRSKSEVYDDIIGAVLLVIKNHCKDIAVSNTRGYTGWKKAISYYQYALNKPAPKIYAQQARKITIEFEWVDGIPEEDCTETIENILTIIKGNGTNVNVLIK